MSSTIPLILKRLSGEILTIYPDGVQDLNDLAFMALPIEERPAHAEKIRILPSENPDEPATLWMDPVEYFVEVDLLGLAYDRQTYQEYAIGLVRILEDQECVLRLYFYFGTEHRQLYRKHDIVEHPRTYWREEDEIAIPPSVQPILPSEFLPAEWASHSTLQEKWNGAFERFCKEVTGDWLHEGLMELAERAMDE